MPEMVFLGRAADQLGRALLGEKWTGKEPCAEILPPARDARATNNLIARHLSQFGRREYHGSMAPPPVSPIGGPHVIHTDRRLTFEFTEQELKALVLFMQQHNEAALEAQARFRKLQNAITEYAVAGRLGTSFRAFAGGTLHPIPAEWWNTERLEQRFKACSINPDDPFGSGAKAWIFVSRARHRENY
jgi:hypothetical protein